MKFILNLLLALGISLPISLFATSSANVSEVNSNVIAKQPALAKYTWDDSATLPSAKQIQKLEEVVGTFPKPASLSEAERIELGQLDYKLGTYYTHVARKPDLAISKLTEAKTLLKDPTEKAWVYNHLAYAYELRFADSKHSDDKQNAFYYANLVIDKNNKNTQEVAFAYCVKGLIFNDAYAYDKAEVNFKNAIAIYENMPVGPAKHSVEEQSIRAKNRLASIILDQHGREDEVFAILLPLEKYWAAKKNLQHNPYAARTFIGLGQAYLKVGKGKLAAKEFKKSLQIYANYYGKHSELLTKIYDLLAQSYELQGKQRLAAQYTKKALALKK